MPGVDSLIEVLPSPPDDQASMQEQVIVKETPAGVLATQLGVRESPCTRARVPKRAIAP